MTHHDNDFLGSDGIERKEAAAMLHLRPDSFSSMVSRNELPLAYIQIGLRKRIYSRRQIIELIQSRRVVPEVA